MHDVVRRLLPGRRTSESEWEAAHEERMRDGARRFRGICKQSEQDDNESEE